MGELDQEKLDCGKPLDRVVIVPVDEAATVFDDSPFRRSVMLHR